MNSSDKVVTIPQAEYDKLLNRDRWLYALEAAGVDNWEGFEEAQRIIEEWDDEDDNS
jgi:uncharacterized heparinase superfamily protein